MSDKKQLLRSLAAVAKKLQRTPSLSEFCTRAGIPKHFVFRFFFRWNDAVRAAGLRPRKPLLKIEDSDLLRDWGKAIRKNQRLLSRRTYLLTGKYDPSTFANRFGSWSSVPQAFRKFAKSRREWADVLKLLPGTAPSDERSKKHHPWPSLPDGAPRAPFKDRPVCGDPLDLPRFRHEPTNEQGVVLLFGMLAKELGYMIESTQKSFPDCEAKRRIGPDRWQRVRIEFEFESRNFHEHRHPVDGCDVIVCWRHNWDQCPKHIEIVELSSEIRPLAHSGEQPLVEKP